MDGRPRFTCFSGCQPVSPREGGSVLGLGAAGLSDMLPGERPARLPVLLCRRNRGLSPRLLPRALKSTCSAAQGSSARRVESVWGLGVSWDGQPYTAPGTVLRTGEGPWLDVMARASLCRAGQEEVAPIPPLCCCCRNSHQRGDGDTRPSPSRPHLLVTKCRPPPPLVPECRPHSPLWTHPGLQGGRDPNHTQG